jgi:hypothetical protein
MTSLRTKIVSAILIALTISCGQLHGQKHAAKTDTAFKPNHYSFDVAATFYSRADVVHLQGEQRLETRPTVSTQLGFMYGRYWRNGLGFRVGFRWSVIPFTTKYNLPYQVVDTALREYGDLGSWESSYDINHWQLPIQLSYHATIKRNWGAKLSAGASIDLQLNGLIENDVNVFYEKNNQPAYVVLHYMRLNVNANRAVYCSMPIELMFSKRWLNKHALEFGIMYNVAFRPIAKGYYIFLPDKPNYSYGTIAIKNTFIALKVCYTLTAGKRQERMPQVLD